MEFTLRNCLLVVLLFGVPCWGMKCHVCNSKDTHDCDDPFDDHDNKYLKDCSDKEVNVTHATLCRKIYQDVNGIIRIYRSCGWIKHEKYDCYRTGAEHYTTYSCSCYEDGCNNGFAIQPGMLSMILMTFMTLVVLART